MMRPKATTGLGSITIPTALLIAALLITTMGGLGGCVATMPAGPSSTGARASSAAYTPAEQRLRAQSNQFAKTSVQGCLAGAAAGALVGILASRDRSRGALIGAMGGCAAGFAVNAYVQGKRSNYRSNEARINAMIADVRADNQRLAGLVETTRSVIADDKRRIASLNAGIRSNQVSTARARAELARVRDNRRLLGNTIGKVKQKEQDWREISAIERQSGANTAALDAEIGKLRGQVATLEAEAALIDREIAASPAAA